MRFGIDMGHTLSGAGTSASGYVKESDKNREVGKRLIAMLQEKGHTVVNCTVDKSSNDLADRVAKANAQTLDLFLSLHLNAYKMTTSEMGVETYSYSSSGTARKYAEKVQGELVNKIGWKNRGCKTANYYVLRNTKAPAVLVELGFCDSQGDMNKWNTENISKALFKAITGSEYVAPVVTPPVTSGFAVGDKVTVSKSATHYATGQSMASFVKGSTYTITELKSDRALLSDIVSWVYLSDLSKSGGSAPTPSFNAYQVVITADVLNVRKGPGTSHPVTTTVRNGQVYTIVGESNGWGQLKSGAGWISLQYTKRR